MSHRDDPQAVAIHFYATAPYPCSYLDGRQARSQVAIPAEAIDAAVYSQLVKLGFRRSGLYTYRPYCDSCQSCVPVRLPVADFSPNRSQRRSWQRLQAMDVSLLPLEYRDDHYQLYHRYQQSAMPVVAWPKTMSSNIRSSFSRVGWTACWRSFVWMAH
jgi:arginine-tRNA-protein transferase